MSDYIIKVENLGKKYRIRHQQEQQRYVALRDILAHGMMDIGSSVPGVARTLARGFLRQQGAVGNGNLKFQAHIAGRMFNNDKFFQAIELWKTILRREATNLDARLRLAQAYNHVGERRDVVREYERILQQHPTHAKTRQAVADLNNRYQRN